MILAGVNQKGILLEELAEELWWKGRQDACLFDVNYFVRSAPIILAG
jgi:hypothetical protein